jgi:hypothetical protein
MASPSLQPKCPKCSSVSLGRSRITPLDRLPSLFDLKPVRCRECRHRFRIHVEGQKRPKTPGGHESSHRQRSIRFREILLYGCALVAFGVMLYMITRERG